MYVKFDFETFVRSISVMTGFTEDQIKTLLAYRDVKYLDETTAADLTAELTKLKEEMIKANPTGFEIKRPQTPPFPLELIEQEANICAFTKLFYGETEAAKLAKFLILALSDPYFDPMLGQKVCSGHRGLTLREMQFTIFLYFNYRELAQEAFEPGEYQAHSRLINMIIAHAYECHILKVDLDKGHYRTAEGERLYAVLQAEDIPLKGKYKDLIDWNALADFRKMGKSLTQEEQGLFMAVRFPEYITDPEQVIKGSFKTEISSIISRRLLAVSMYDKRVVSREMAAELAGVNQEDFVYILRTTRAGIQKTSGPAGQKDYKTSHPEGQEDVKR